MALLTRREFVQQATFVAATLYGWPAEALGRAERMFQGRKQNGAALDPAAIRKLASEMTGHVITAEQPDYEAARQVFNSAFDLHPAVIVRCGSASDVARCLDFA